jgi:uncharacterized protein YndB with AHSA1/START domain
MSKNKLVVTLPSDTEIKQTRDFDAPRDLVYKVMTDPDLVPKWWGLRENTTRIDAMDLRPGGKWRFVQADMQGNEHAFRGEYSEIVPNERTVATFEYEPLAGHICVEHTTYEDLGDNRTRVTTVSKFDSQEDRDGMLQSGMESGANESMDQAEELLAELQGAKA